jgi:hypothetical protein
MELARTTQSGQTQSGQVQQQQQGENDLQLLPQLINAWQQNREEMLTLASQMKEKKTREKALQTVILGTMKHHKIGALDLTKSGGRLLYKEKTKKGGLSQKSLQGFLAEHMKSPEDATKALAFITEKRGTKTVETLSFEKL